MRGFAGIAGSLAVAVMLAALPAAAAAHVYKPTRLDDPPPGKCRAHDCSLREAVDAAGDHSGPDRIALGKGTYELTLPVASGGGELEILASDISMRGKGPRKTRIDANDTDRVIGVSGEPFAARDLTLTGGDAGANPEHSSEGGGMLALTPKLMLKRVVIRNNEALSAGGLYAIADVASIKQSTISGNIANEGGGLRLASWTSQLVTTIRSSTISGNTATNKAGGILADGHYPINPGVPPVLNMITSTVAGNQANNEAGGIMADNGASVTLGGSTVADNKADANDSGGGVGGGIHQHSGATFVFADSVLAKNKVGTSGTDPQCSGSFTSNPGAIFQQQPAPCTTTGSPTVTPQARIGVLADNAGPTKTIKLLHGSPAIGHAIECAKRDQRGVKRPADGCDSGAYERRGP
jgi:hypothetical protein